MTTLPPCCPDICAEHGSCASSDYSSSARRFFFAAAAISVFNLIHKDIGDEVLTWAHRFHIAPGNRFVEHLFEKLLTVTKRQLILTGIVLLAYSAMFLIEGIGLLLLKHWAEWMTVITTAGLIPFEIYEMIHRPTRLKAAAMMINIVVAAYLAFRVRREAMEAKRLGQLSPT